MHHPAAALGKREKTFPQTGEVLLDGETADRPSFSTIPISELSARPLAAKKLMLDTDRKIAYPTADLNEIPIGGYSTVNQHQRRWAPAVIADEAPPELKQHGRKILIDDVG